MYTGQLLQSESTAARRRVYFHCVDATDGMTPETGEAGGQPEISKNGGAWASTSATLTAIGNGRYYVTLTTGELDTLGNIQLRYKSANTAEAVASAQVVLHDPNVASLTAAGVWAAVVEGSLTALQLLKLAAAAAAGKLSGAQTTSIVIRNVSDTADAITSTVDAYGNRSSITTNV